MSSLGDEEKKGIDLPSSHLPNDRNDIDINSNDIDIDPTTSRVDLEGEGKMEDFSDEERKEEKKEPSPSPLQYQFHRRPSQHSTHMALHHPPAIIIPSNLSTPLSSLPMLSSAGTDIIVSPASPLSPPSPPSTDSEDTPPIHKSNLYTKPLLYYRRANNNTSTLTHTPTQVLLPDDSSMLLGFPPLTAQKEEIPYLLVFAHPSTDSHTLQRIRACIYFLITLIILDFSLVTIVWAAGSHLTSVSWSDGRVETLTLVCWIVEIALVVAVMVVRESRVLTLCICIVAFDAFLNLIRVYSVLLLLHFLLQMAICLTLSLLKSDLQPVWFTPAN